MQAIKDIFRVVIDALNEELAPLNSIYHDFAKYRIEANFDMGVGGFHLEVHAPKRVQIFIPKTYESFPVRFFEWEENMLSLDAEISVVDHMHHIYSA